jgi:RHS repeat-associated protein
MRAAMGALRAGLGAGLAAMMAVALGISLNAATPTPASAANTGWCGIFSTWVCEPTANEAGYQAYAGFLLFETYYGPVPSGKPGLMYAIYSAYCTGTSCPIYYFCPDGTEQAMNPGGTCPSGPPPCTCNNSGTPAPKTPFPIDILSGNKTLTAEDFANSTRSLVLTRVHASAAQINPTSWRSGVATGPLAFPAGLGNWLYDFQVELHISGMAPASPVLALMPDGEAPAFAQNTVTPSSTTLVPYTGTLPTNPQTSYTLTIQGSAWPTNLTAQATTWTLTDGNDTVYTLQTYLDPGSGVYDIARPIQIQWRDGHSWTLSYGAKSSYHELDTVTDNFGNQLNFAWITAANTNVPEAIGTVTIGSISAPSGYYIGYNYQSIGGSQGGVSTPDILSSVEYSAPSGSTPSGCPTWAPPSGVVLDCTVYQYGNTACPYNATAVVDSGGIQRWGVAYDSTSCMATVSSVNGAAPGQTGAIRAYQVAYTAVPSGAGSFTRSVTNPLGTVSIYNYVNNTTASQGLQLAEVDENVGSSPVTGLCSGGTPSAGESFRCYQYGANGFVSQLQDENGNIETLPTYDPRGMATQSVEASGTPVARTTNTSWDATFHEPDTVALPSLITTAFSYNAAGQVLTKTLTDETSFTTPYATNGRTRTWTNVYNSGGELQAAHGPRWAGGSDTTDTVTYAYNANGYLQSATDALSHTTSINTVDWRGAPTKATDPNGVVTTVTYDIHGRILTRTINPGASQSEWQYLYDAMGDLTQLTLPTNGTLKYAYDQGQRLTTVTDIRNETKTFAYDANDDPVKLTIANGSGTTTFTHSAAYDEWGRAISLIGAASQTWSLAYDNLSNLTEVSDPAVGSNPANVRKTSWDALNRATVQIDPLSYTVKSAFDLNDNLNQLTDGDGLITAREVDGFGETIQEASPQRGTIAYTYDADGNLTKEVDGRGIETDQTFDAASRLTQTSYPSDTNETVTYTYDIGNDGIGRLTGVTDAAGSETWTYDAQGRVISDARTVAAGGDSALFTTAYAWDANGELTGVTYPSADVATYTRTTDGLVTAVSFTPKGGTAETLASNVAFAPYGPLTGATQLGGLTLTRSYNQDYQQAGLETASGSVLLNASFGWQADGRIASVTDNLVPAQGPTSRTAAYTYAATGRLAGAAGPWGSQSWSFDGGGNLVSSASSSSAPGTQTLAWTYDAAGMMITASAGGTGTGAWAYRYDGLRAWRAPVGAGAQTSYVYDQAGQTLAEANAATGVASKEYIWLGDQLLGVAIPGGSLYAATIGQNDEPQALTTPTGTLAWSGYAQPFGGTTTFSTPTISLDLGYPGQWSQPEAANLARNGVRDYDLSLGRYAEPDPLGIDAAPNPYAYVDGDPLNESDPWGLVPNPGEGTCIEPVDNPICYAALAADALSDIAAAGAAASHAMSTGADAQKKADYDAYKRICDEPPPPGLCGQALLQWKLNKARACQEARQNFANRWHGGKLDQGHADQMDQLNNQIEKLLKALGKSGQLK